MTAPETERGGPAAAPRLAFSHVGIHVHDLARMTDFYTRFLGFLVTDRGTLDTPQGPAALVFLSRDPREHHQIVLVSGRPATLAYNVVNQLSFRAETLADLRAMHARLTDEPVSDVAAVSHGNALSVYFRDPEGNRIELFVDTPWYVDQPLRVPFDIARPDDEVWAWAEAHARAQPGFRPRADWEAEMRRRMGPPTPRPRAGP